VAASSMQLPLTEDVVKGMVMGRVFNVSHTDQAAQRSRRAQQWQEAVT
jgi:hypothetical protein